MMVVLLDDDDPPFEQHRIVDRGNRTTNAATIPLQRILVGARDDATNIITTIVRELDQMNMLVFANQDKFIRPWRLVFVGGRNNCDESK
jgi:hypothetical protein